MMFTGLPYEHRRFIIHRHCARNVFLGFRVAIQDAGFTKEPYAGKSCAGLSPRLLWKGIE